jgi:hypothetical protein
MEDFISLFISMLCHLKCIETTNEKTSKIYYFILEFHNTKFYFVLLVLYEMKGNLLTIMLVLWGLFFK